MAYCLYLDGVLFPITPEKITVKITGKSETVTLINEGEASILKSPGLSAVEFKLCLPNQQYPVAVYPEGYKPAVYYLEKLESLKLGKKPFPYVLTRTDPANKKLFDTNMTVSLEEYTITEQADDGFDVTVEVKLQQYKEFVTKTCSLDLAALVPRASIQTPRAPSSNAPSAGTHTVKEHESLWVISKKYYGNGASWQTIYNANKSVIGGNPNLIYPGQVLTIPPV